MNLLSFNQVLKKTKLSETKLNHLLYRGLFPVHWDVVENQKRWLNDEVRRWMKEYK